ncbi:MaoC family dehydratase [Aurantimonas sp. A2-1-M11]|uniref:MaoC family dehydratase n=1 Tax=Aurantimonas sp. A2-1-M11 TaxID=3113712 RepID=UPI002F92CA3E
MTFWDSLTVGEARILGSHIFAADDIKRFAAKFDPQPFHLDEVAAKGSVLGGLCASGWHTAGVCMRLNVENQVAFAKDWIAAGNRPPRMGPSPGVTNLRWPKPVYVGDTITFTQTLTAKRASGSRPGWGVLEFTTLGVNQHGETVFSFDGAAFCGTD